MAITRQNAGRSQSYAEDIQLSTETKFMQNYIADVAAHGGGEIISIMDSLQRMQIFTTGSDNTIWNYYFDDASESGFSSISTGLVGKSIAAELDASGNVVLFGTSNVTLCYVEQSMSAAGVPTWGSVRSAQVPTPPSPIAISKVFAQYIGNELYIGTLTQINSVSSEPIYAFAYSIWNSNPGVFTATTLRLSSLNCTWSGTATSTAEFTCLDVTYLGFNIATAQVVHYAMAAIFTSKAVAFLPGSGFFAVLDDGNLYHLVGGSGTSSYSWAQITQQMSLRDFRADEDASGAAQLFALGTDSILYHIEPVATGGWLAPAPIRTGMALLSVGTHDSGTIELFLVGTALGALTHMVLAADADDWEVSSIDVPSSGQIEEISSYSTDVIVLDARGARLPGIGVEVRASSRVQISVSGSTYVVDATRAAVLTTNGLGMITVTQQTSRLGVPSLAFSVVGRQASGSTIAVQQFAGVQAQLDTITSTDLLDATVNGGAPLLDDQYRNSATTDALAKAFNSCMLITNDTAVRLDGAAFAARHRKKGVGHCAAGSVGRLNRVAAGAGSRHWQLDLSGGQPVYRDLTADQAKMLLAEKRARHVSTDEAVGGFLDVLEDIGDFIEGVGQGIVDVVDTVVTAVGDAVQAAITFVVDGVTYLFNAVVDVIEQAFDLVETILASVKVFFDKVFEWLAFLFDWPDIVRTKQALVYTAKQFLGFLQGAPGGIQALFDAGMATAAGEVDALFDALVGQLTGATLGGYVQNEQPSEPKMTAALGNNIVLNGTIDHSANATIVSSGMSLADAVGDGSFDGVIAQLNELVQTIEGLPEFAEALSYMENLGGAPDEIFQQLLAALLRIVQGIIKAVLAGVKTVVDLMLQMVAALIGAVEAVLTDGWDIPFVSDLYATFAGGTLSTLDLLALIIAIPSTVLYKAMEGTAPFADDAALAAFEATFSAASILSASGLGSNAAPARNIAVAAGVDEADGVAESPSAGVLLVGIAGTVSTFVFGVLSGIMDFKPVLGTGKPDPVVKTLSKFALGAEILAQAAATPWITSTSAPDCTTRDGAGQVLWLCETVGVLLDIGFMWRDSTFPENDDTDTGVWVSFAYGCGHALTFAIVARNMSALGIASKICMLIPELGKLLRLTKIETSTEGVSLGVIAALDGIDFLASAILAFADSIFDTDQPQKLSAARIPGAVLPG